MFEWLYRVHNRRALGKKRICFGCKGRLHSDGLVECEVVGELLTASKVKSVCRCVVCGQVIATTLWIPRKQIKKNTLEYCVKSIYEA